MRINRVSIVLKFEKKRFMPVFAKQIQIRTELKGDGIVTDRFNYIKRGYDPEEADLYIETLERELKAYKEKDNSIRTLYLTRRSLRTASF